MEGRICATQEAVFKKMRCDVCGFMLMACDIFISAFNTSKLSTSAAKCSSGRFFEIALVKLKVTGRMSLQIYKGV
jgi:hypothetical protein